MSRTLEQAKQNAERLRLELPHLIQPSATDYDMVLLADALAAAERDAERYRWLRTSNWLASYGWHASELDAAIDAAREGK